MENQPHRLRLLREDGEPAVLFVIAPQAVVPKNMAVSDGLPEPELQPFRQLAHLILRHAGHHHQPELAVAVQSVDVVVLEQDGHAAVQQFLRILDTVQRIPGKPGNLLGDNQVEPPLPGVCNHAQEPLPPPGAGAGDALVHIAGDVCPPGIFFNQLRVVLNLVFQTALLFRLFRGNPGVKGHPQGQVIDGHSLPEPLPEPRDSCHSSPPPP